MASASPRRKQLLAQIGVNCLCQPVDIDETPFENEPVVKYVKRLAKTKATAGWEQSDKSLPVLGADTIVVHNNQLMGKPQNKTQAVATLKQLSGQSHYVYSAVAVVSKGNHRLVISQNEVVFDDIPADMIESYVASGEPMDKAGSYGIQGMAALWIKKITGSYSSVMGLPLYETGQILSKLDIITVYNPQTDKSDQNV
nr:Maf family protein [Marinicella rhabdoformis]